jgi:hypothetical protein
MKKITKQKLTNKKFNKREFIYWAKKARIVIERVAKERETDERPSNFAF